MPTHYAGGTPGAKSTLSRGGVSNYVVETIKEKVRPPCNVANFFNKKRKDQPYFQKIPQDPSLFEMEINQEDYDHLIDDDLDLISKYEVIYKLLKAQLRGHQQKLIDLKE
mgnify:CR=1 FL=1